MAASPVTRRTPACRRSAAISSEPLRAEHVPKWDVAVVPRLTRQSQHPLGHDVALDLVAATGDAVPRGAEHVVGPGEGPPLAGVGQQARPEQLRYDLAHPRHP